MVKSSETVLYLEQPVPKREASATKLLAPWMGILINIDNSKTNEQGFKVGAGAADIKAKFKEYNPERLDIFHDYHGHHEGTALLTFKNGIQGLEDAQAFQQAFAAGGRGRKEWWDEERPANLDLYGWQATEDLAADLGLLKNHLRLCELTTVKQMVEKNERLNKQIVDDLVKTVIRRNDTVAVSHHQFVMLRNMVNIEVDGLRIKAEDEKRKMEEQHKRDLEQMKLRIASQRGSTQ